MAEFSRIWRTPRLLLSGRIRDKFSEKRLRNLSEKQICILILLVLFKEMNSPKTKN